MPRLITSRGALVHSQPKPNVCINWAHSLARGLKFATLFNRPHNPYNHVLSTRGIMTTPARWRGSSRNSLVFYGDVSTSIYLKFPQAAFSFDGWTALTCVIGVFQHSSGGDFDPWISSTNYNTGFFFGRNQSQRQQFYIETQQLLDYGTCYDDDKWVVHGATWSKADTYAAHFVNGVKVADETDARWDITINYTSDLCIGAAPFDGLYCKSEFDYAYMWNRRLSESEMLQIFLDPYGFFMLEKPTLRLLSIAGAGLSIPVAMNTYRQRRA